MPRRRAQPNDADEEEDVTRGGATADEEQPTPEQRLDEQEDLERLRAQLREQFH